MDITLVNAHFPDRQHIYVRRSLVDLSTGRAMNELERMPREVLAIRAAEYDLEPGDDFVLDLVMLERFSPVAAGPGDVHPLYSADSVKDALEIMHERVEMARAEHGAPKGANRLLAAAVRNGVASNGLVDAYRLCTENADPRVMKPIQRLRDQYRERLRGLRSHPVH